MRIAISGVSSTGKSTLARQVGQQLGIPCLLDVDIHDKAWALLEKRGLMPKTKFFPDLSKEEHIEFERAVCKSWWDMEEILSHGIFDESPLDFINYFYSVCAAHRDIMPPVELKYLIDESWKRIKTYDIIWYLPFGKLNIVEDGRRFTNQNQLEYWDYSLRGLVEEARNRGVDVRMMDPSILPERVAEVVHSIMSLQKE